MKVNIYKLGEYKIIESDTGEVRWEAHFGLGGLQEGRCFNKGSILFIGPVESQCDGFLKLEFIDHLKEFPDWLKTTYYCENLEVFHCKTGKKVAVEDMRWWMLDQGREKENMAFSSRPGDDSKDLSSLIPGEVIDFRLQRYQINKKADGQVVWQAYAGLGMIRTGTCIIVDDILFMGPWQDEQTTLIKQQFHSNLEQMPAWNQTTYYCPKFSLHECKAVSRVWEEKKRWLDAKEAKETNDVRRGYQNSAELKSLHAEPGRIVSARLLAALQSLVKPIACRGKRARFFRFNFKKPDMPKNIGIFRPSGIKKWLTCSAVLVLFTVLLFLFFLVGQWKEHFKKPPHKKGAHPSSHRRDR